MKLPELFAMGLYLLLVLGIGVYFFIRERKKSGSEKSYFLGGRMMNGWVSALSAGASDMSAWVLMGLPGAIYLSGMGQVWIAIGLLIGTVTAWTTVAPVLRRYSIVAGDAITIPQFLTRRFCSGRKEIMVLSAIVFVVTYCIYSAASLYVCGTLFHTVLGVDPKTAMIVSTVVIVVYTFLGGYSAVCWTDFFQGLLMLAALMLIPIACGVIMSCENFVAPAAKLSENYWNFLSTGKADWKSFCDIITGLGWGLGYFGMPHILIRYFSVKDEKEMRKSRIIGCTWFVLILAASCAVGLVGRKYLGDILIAQNGSELVFINMIRSVFDKVGSSTGLTVTAVFLGGITLSAILAAAMSTADSQLLASSSAFASDLYKPIIRKKASEKEMLWAGRSIVVIISLVAYCIAASPQCQGLMALVSCAWGAFGAAFGPVILLALYWKRLTYWGAFAGILAGFAVDICWYLFMQWTLIYEIIPGFIAGLAAAAAVSYCDAAPGADVIANFNKSREKID